MVFISSQYCYPQVSAAGDWAKWFPPLPCDTPWFLYVTAVYSNAGEGTLRAEGFGRVVEYQRSAGIETVCLSDPYFVAHSSISGGTGVGSTNTRVDIFKAHRDGLWTSSTQLTFKANATRAATITGGSVNTVSLAVAGTSRTLLTLPTGAAMGTPAPAGCAGATTTWFQVTVYDDGSVSVP